MFDLIHLSTQVGHALRQNSQLLTTAESCTGGYLADVVTSVSGSSKWFDRGFVPYSEKAKQQMLGVSPEILAAHGTVSEAVVCAMAEGALQNSHAHVAVAVTGIAGPAGGTDEIPVGTVWIAWLIKEQPILVRHYLFHGERTHIRRLAVTEILRELLNLLRPSV